MGDGRPPRSALLLLLPGLVYAASYAYLAWYHGRIDLLRVPVHESGRYTLLETTLFASHFLGHLPTLTTLALLFVGVHRCLAPVGGAPPRVPGGWRGPALGLLLLLGASVAISLLWFGAEDTLAFLSQRRQRAGDHVVGGSWSLHLPSTMVLFCGLPIYLALARWLFGRPLRPSAGGGALVAGAGAATVLTTWLVSPSLSGTLWLTWSDPRYLAHAVRELATFPLTYFPLPLWLWWRRRPPAAAPGVPLSRQPRALALLAALAALALAGFGWQVVGSLRAGVGQLAQKPAFARGGQLGVAYLLASHYFEHVLDSIFFTLTCALIAQLARGGAARGSR